MPTATIAPPTATIVHVELGTPRPTVDPAVAATQAVSVVDASQIVWSGSISLSVFTQITSKDPGDQEAFQIPASKTVFTLHTRPIIIAAYVYELSSQGQRHVRFLLYERGGKRDGLVVPPFLYKMDLPLGWIGGHEDYGDYNQLIRGLEAQFEHPILPDYLSMAVVSAKNCEDANDVNRQLCSELARRDIELPVDYEAAEALVMDQWDIAIQKTTTEVTDVEQIVGLVKEIGTAWWDDSRFALFYLPRLTVCLPGDRPLCGTYITYLSLEMPN